LPPPDPESGGEVAFVLLIVIGVADHHRRRALSVDHPSREVEDVGDGKRPRVVRGLLHVRSSV